MAKWRLATATATLRSYLRPTLPTIYAVVNPTRALSGSNQCRSYITSLADDDDPRGKWLTLPPFSPTVDGSALGKELFSDGDSVKGSTDGSTTALRWILRCRPDLPRNLVLKLFRLRQVLSSLPIVLQLPNSLLVVNFLPL